MEMQEYKLCKRGHVRSPENTNKRGNCILCIRELSIVRARAAGVKPMKKDVCLHGHPLTKDNLTKQGTCKTCKAIRDKQYRESYPEKALARRREYAAQNKESISEYMKAYQKAHYAEQYPKMKERTLRYYKENPQKTLERLKSKRDLLDATYVKQTLGVKGLKTSDVPPELIAIKRQQLLFKRELKKMREVISG